MLEPQRRRHLMEALRPPPGYHLDRAIGTTFSLDLLALLTAPLAFTIFDWEDEDGRPTADPLALLESLRRYADRVAVFCQAGQITVPANRQPLYGYLEDSVFEVTAPRKGGVFHPKVWAIRFVSEGEPVLYRLLVLSRNLTFDRSWDTVLTLEGELSDRKNAHRRNHPLGDFFEALPTLALRTLPEGVRKAVDVAQHELRRVWFEPPLGFESVAFWPLGLSRSRQWPFHDVRRMLVVSPFVKDALLQKLPGTNGGILVSRPEALSQLKPETIGGFEQTLILRPEAESEGERPEEGVQFDEVGEEIGEQLSEDGEGETLTGLHAKLFVADDGWYARMWTGSANATNAAFRSNVEFLVEMGGRKRECGINEMMKQPGDATGFADLLQEYMPESESSTDLARERLEDRANDARRFLAAARLTASIDGAPDGTHLCDVRLRPAEGAGLVLPEGVSARCWPITLTEADAVTLDLDSASTASFSLSLESIISFFAFEITAVSAEASLTRRFVLGVALKGAPGDRKDRIVRSLLSDKDRVMRLILFLLAEGDVDQQQASLNISRLLGAGSGKGQGLPGVPLFEEMVRALWSNPDALDQIEAMLASLRKTEEGAQLIPDELDEIWKPLRAARQKARR